MINLLYKGQLEFKTNYENKNFRYKGSIESKKYNDFFNEVNVNDKQAFKLIRENRAILENRLLSLIEKNVKLNNKLDYLINKFNVLKKMKQEGNL